MPVISKRSPEINVADGDLNLVTKRGWAAVLAANRPPVLFRRGGLPVRIERDDTGSPVLVRVDDDRLRHRAAEVAFWYEPRNDTRGRRKKVQKYPPREVIKNMLATPDQQLPIVARIVGSPIFGPDGTLHRAPGYNSATRCYYAPEQGFSLPRLRARVTQRTLNRAKTLILDRLLSDFPFAAPSDKAHALRDPMRRPWYRSFGR